MVKFIAALILLISFLGLPKQIIAQAIADSSALLNNNPAVSLSNQKIIDNHLKRTVIREVLQGHNSPLAQEADAFIEACVKYDIDCYLLPSISGLESSYGKKILKGSYNPFGWGGGYILFESWSQGFHAVARGLRNNYYNRGAKTIEDIAPIYAESKTWAPRVSLIREQFEKKEKELLLSTNYLSLMTP